MAAGTQMQDASGRARSDLPFERTDSARQAAWLADQKNEQSKSGKYSGVFGNSTGSGAFTGPNNDPNTPGMTREWTTEPALEAFNPDDSRYAKRKSDMDAQEQRMKLEAIKEEARQRTEQENYRNALLNQQLADAREAKRNQDERDRQEQELRNRQFAAKQKQDSDVSRITGKPANPEMTKDYLEKSAKAEVNATFRENMGHITSIRSIIPNILDQYRTGGDIKQLAEMVPDDSLKEFIIKIASSGGPDTAATRAKHASDISAAVSRWADAQEAVEVGSARITGDGSVGYQKPPVQ
jgi:hypothetical protein